MCLQYQGIDDDNGVVHRVRQEIRLSNNNVVVVRIQGIDDASEISDTTTEAARI